MHSIFSETVLVPYLHLGSVKQVEESRSDDMYVAFHEASKNFFEGREETHFIIFVSVASAS